MRKLSKNYTAETVHRRLNAKRRAELEEAKQEQQKLIELSLPSVVKAGSSSSNYCDITEEATVRMLQAAIHKPVEQFQ